MGTVISAEQQMKSGGQHRGKNVLLNTKNFSSQ